MQPFFGDEISSVRLLGCLISTKRRPLSSQVYVSLESSISAILRRANEPLRMLVLHLLRSIRLAKITDLIIATITIAMIDFVWPPAIRQRPDYAMD
jgi:hypothetical protein